MGGLDSIFGTSIPEYVSITGGAQKIALKLAANVGHDNIKLNSKVVSIINSSSGEHFNITTENGTVYYAKKIICAVEPPHYMKLLKEIVPKESDLMKAIEPDAFVSGPVSRFVIGFDKAYWKQLNFTGIALVLNGKSKLKQCSGAPISFHFDTTNANGGLPQFSGIVGGSRSAEWSQLSDETFKEHLLETICTLVGSDWPKRGVQFFAVKHWGGHAMDQEPVASTISAIGRMHDFRQLNKPHLDGKLLFAGSATSVLVGSSSMNGAVETGLRAAARIIN